MIESVTKIIVALLGSGTLGAIVTWFFTRKKVKADLFSKNQKLEGELREQLRKEANELRNNVLDLEKQLFRLEQISARQERELYELENRYDQNLKELAFLKGRFNERNLRDQSQNDA